MKNVWRKLFNKKRPLTNQHGPAVKKKQALDKAQIAFPDRDETGRWVLNKAEETAKVYIAKLTEELATEAQEIQKLEQKSKPKATTAKNKNCKCQGKTACKCKKPASGTSGASKAKVAKPATAKQTPKKPKSK